MCSTIRGRSSRSGATASCGLAATASPSAISNDAGAHRRALRAGSVRRCRRRAHVPQRRPRSLASRRHRSSFSAGSTIRSSCEDSASSRAKSKPPSVEQPGSAARGRRRRRSTVDRTCPGRVRRLCVQMCRTKCATHCTGTDCATHCDAAPGIHGAIALGRRSTLCRCSSSGKADRRALALMAGAPREDGRPSGRLAEVGRRGAHRRDLVRRCSASPQSA